MYSSPVTPTGTGHSHPSSTNTRVLMIGDPISTAPGVSGPLIVAHTVASVGPYALISRRPPAHRAATSPASRSPAATSVDTPAKLPASTTASTAGGTVTCVTACRATSPSKLGPGNSSPAEASTSIAPPHSPTTSSATDASNPGDANTSSRLPEPTANRSTCAATRPARPPCGTTTAFGTPVDPDV